MYIKQIQSQQTNHPACKYSNILWNMQIFNIPDPIIFPFHVDFFTHIDTGTPDWGKCDNFSF